MTLPHWLTKGIASLHTISINMVRHEYTPRGLALLFIGALCTGAFIKLLVHDRITMGYDDYTLSRDKTILDLNIIQKQLIHEGGTLATDKADTPNGPSCSEDRP